MAKSKSQYCRFHYSFWLTALARNMTANEIAVRFYIYSCPSNNGLGCFSGDVESLRVGFCSTMKGASFKRIFNQLIEKKVVEQDVQNRMIFIPGYIPGNPPGNDGAVLRLGNNFNKLPDCDFKAKCYVEFKNVIDGMDTKKRAMQKAFYSKVQPPPNWQKFDGGTAALEPGEIPLPGYDGQTVPELEAPPLGHYEHVKQLKPRGETASHCRQVDTPKESESDDLGYGDCSGSPF